MWKMLRWHHTCFLTQSEVQEGGSFTAGKSCHNQSIERFWRDLFHGCTFIFYHVFCYMEENGLLHISNQTHLFCLHYIFLPRINRHLQQQGYDHHTIRTESNMSPVQLWVSGLTSSCGAGISDLENVNGYGVDLDGPLPSERYDGGTMLLKFLRYAPL